MSIARHFQKYACSILHPHPTLDNPRHAADAILDWAVKKSGGFPNMATSAEFVARHERYGYKPTSQMSAEETKALTQQQAVICHALEDIHTTGTLHGDAGYRLRFLSETGQAYSGTVGKPQPASQNNP